MRIVYDRPGFENIHQHVVRSAMEAKVCDWLMQRRIAHRHAGEIFTVSLGPRGAASIYVPDIILHDRTKSGKIVIIEPYQVSVPKKGGTKLLAAFREQNKGQYYMIIIARRQYKKYILKGSYDAFIEIEKLDTLEKKIPLPPV
ncbi:MAG: hypothetical protein ACKVRP_07215 [Bacteroidota bacterium]